MSKRAAIIRGLLFAGSKLFTVAIKGRRFLSNARILRDTTLGVQVIAIGNLTVGGTGKTPVVEKFARELRDAGRNVAILSRGYRSKPPPLHKSLIDRLLFRRDSTPPSCLMENPCCSIPKWPATNPTCSRRISKMSSCSWTKIA